MKQTATDIIVERLQQGGFRDTATRRAILDVFQKRVKPVSAPELSEFLSEKGFWPNKTTVYRELAFLRDQEILHEVQFMDGTRRYEMASETHHHHLVCVDCDAVEEVVVREDLEQEEKRLARAKRFKILNHSLEFYGICGKCQLSR
jgi:Fur family ferric uptake transcriptional regulator